MYAIEGLLKIDKDNWGGGEGGGGSAILGTLLL